MPQTHITAVPGNQDLWITREFDAPCEKVFRAFTDPALLVQWLGPRGLRMEIDYMDCRTGGSYRYVHIDPAGHAYGFNGVIHEVAVPERIIQTFEFEGLPERGHVSLETALFEALPDGRTRVRIQSVFRSAEDRDGMVASGMEHGVVDSHNRLDELFAQDQSPS